MEFNNLLSNQNKDMIKGFNSNEKFEFNSCNGKICGEGRGSRTLFNKLFIIIYE